MANRPVLDVTKREQLEQLLREGASLTDAAATLGVSYKTVQKGAATLGVRPAPRARPRYTDDDRRAAVDLYLAGHSTGEVARMIGASDSWVQDQLRKAGLHTRRVGLSATDSLAILDRYKAGESSGAIARSMTISDSTVSNHLRRHGLMVRPSGWAARKYALRDDAFDDVGATSAYWAGFLLADGCVSDTNRITLALQARDVDHVQAWLTFLGTAERHYNLTSTKVRAQVSSPRLAAALARHGVVPRKSQLDVPTSQQLANHPAFWRGMVDGDGSVTYAKGKHGPAIVLVGTPAVMAQYVEFLATSVLDGFRPRVLSVSSTKVIRQVRLEGRRARSVIAALWADVQLEPGGSVHTVPSRPALDRKLPRVRAALAWKTRTEQATALKACTGIDD